MPPELNQPEYIHILINHVPVYGLVTAIAALIIGMVSGNRAVGMTGCLLVFLTALSFWPVSESGEDAYDRVYAMSGADAQKWLDVHASRADRCSWLYYLTAAAAAAGLAAGWKRKAWAVWLHAGVLALAIGSLAAGVWISQAGGKVRHSEFRDGPPPATSHGH